MTWAGGLPGEGEGKFAVGGTGPRSATGKLPSWVLSAALTANAF